MWIYMGDKLDTAIGEYVVEGIEYVEGKVFVVLVNGTERLWMEKNELIKIVFNVEGEDNGW